MGIVNRIGNLVKSYLADDASYSSRSGAESFSDPDLADAYNELNDFLNDDSFKSFDVYAASYQKRARPQEGGGAQTARTARTAKSGAQTAQTAQSARTAKSGAQSAQTARTAQTAGRPPEALRGDFAELNLAFGASEADCRAAYKKLLKIHHPDRHAGHEGNMKKATAKSARINAAYGRICAWREKGKS